MSLDLLQHLQYGDSDYSTYICKKIKFINKVPTCFLFIIVGSYKASLNVVYHVAKYREIKTSSA